MRNLLIRKENVKDFAEVSSLLQNAFKKGHDSFDNEDRLVERLRNASSFIDELSLVAELDTKIVGYILLTQIEIIDEEESYPSLALAPIAVLTNYQKKGIGAKLIKAAHIKAKELGYKSIVLLGHADYYPKFGYQLASKFGVNIPFEAPDENCMLIELEMGSLKDKKGMVKYPKEFYEN